MTAQHIGDGQIGDHFLQSMLHPESLGLIQEFSETFMVIAKDKTSQKCFPRRCPKEGVVPIFRYVDPYNQILPRMPYLSAMKSEFFSRF